eukprot:TRINITY_DN14641_c0_g1_i1.p1 TRINITY_DN14641_c0_g1~~TRINITY_DN14641_c0_g1_i1.p1  ORF type:complete len:121 (-),score=16.88 TRINITY_DN14641_c0_g1_i1:175-537(-)
MTQPAGSTRTRNDVPAPTKSQIGNATWTILHTMAIHYPDHPTEKHKIHALAFLEALSVLYPCSYCAKDFAEDLKQHPANVENGKEFNKWLCEAHNRVNVKLGKPEFDCNKVEQRWKVKDL